MHRWIKYLLWGLSCTSLAIVMLVAFRQNGYSDESEEHRLIRTLQKAFITQMDKSNDLKCCMIGVAGRDEIKEFSFYFMSSQRVRPYEIPKARKIALNCSETLLDMVNSNKPLKPHLAKHPFTCKNVNLSIFFEQSKEEAITSRSLRGVAVRDGKVTYNIYGEKEFEIIDIQEEPYSKALELVHEPAPRHPKQNKAK